MQLKAQWRTTSVSSTLALNSKQSQSQMNPKVCPCHSNLFGIKIQIHELKFMGEQESTSTIAPASKPLAGDISAMPAPQTLKSTNKVLKQSISQLHTVAGLSYDAVNFPLLDKVATKYKSFEVPLSFANKQSDLQFIHLLTKMQTKSLERLQSSRASLILSLPLHKTLSFCSTLMCLCLPYYLINVLKNTPFCVFWSLRPGKVDIT